MKVNHVPLRSAFGHVLSGVSAHITSWINQKSTTLLTFSHHFTSSSKAMPPENCNDLPVFMEGAVVKGFGRGSKELGIPTANFPEDVVEKLPASISSGIYYGWASVDQGPVYKMVMSIGWNPFYENQKKSMETHLLHEFQKDFYGSSLKVAILGYIRPEENFTSLDELVKTIRNDIQIAEDKLNEPKNSSFSSHTFFQHQNGSV